MLWILHICTGSCVTSVCLIASVLSDSSKALFGSTSVARFSEKREIILPNGQRRMRICQKKNERGWAIPKTRPRSRVHLLAVACWPVTETTSA
jgi:hypothetical protein